MSSITLPNEDLDKNNRFFGRDITNIANQQGKQNSRNKSNGRPKTPVQQQNPKGEIKILNKENIEQQRRRGFSLHNNNQNSNSSLTESTDLRIKQIEEEDKSNPQMVGQYQQKIFEYLRNIENNHKVVSSYMEKQQDITEDMRGILVDWLVQVHQKFKLLPETLFMAIALIDKYLEKCQVDRENLQLVGITSLFISSKYEEIYPPHTRDFVEVTDRAYSKYQLFEMEGKILQALDFEITMPSCLRFLDRYCRIMNIVYESKQYMLCRYLMELTLMDVKYLKYSPSNIACSAIYLSGKLFYKEECWNDTIANNSKYSEKTVRICAKDMCFQLKSISSCPNEAIRKKFLTKKFLEIATIQIEDKQTTQTNQ